MTCSSIRSSSYLLDISSIRIGTTKENCTYLGAQLNGLVRNCSIFIIGIGTRRYYGIPQGHLALAIEINYRMSAIYLLKGLLSIISSLFLTLCVCVNKDGIVLSISTGLKFKWVPSVTSANCCLVF